MKPITNYEKNKTKIDVAIFVSRNNGLLSRLIRWITKSNWSHTGFIVREEIFDTIRSVIYEADFKSGIVRKVPASWRLSQLTYEIYPVKVDKEEIVNKLQTYWGKPYDVQGAILSVICDTHTKNEVYCSEMVRDVMGWNIDNKRGFFPDDVRQILRNKLY